MKKQMLLLLLGLCALPALSMQESDTDKKDSRRLGLLKPRKLFNGEPYKGLTYGNPSEGTNENIDPREEDLIKGLKTMTIHSKK